MSFQALVVRKINEKEVEAKVESLEVTQLPAENVLVNVEYSSFNYKDGLCLSSGSGLVRNYPHVGGIDFAGTVESSDDSRYKAGDKVILTGWRVGEMYWGGFSQKVRVNADFLVPLPANLTTRQSMILGTAGFTAVLATEILEEHGLKPTDGPVLVTGATGGVGSIASLFLSSLGYEVSAVTGNAANSDYLHSLGVKNIIAREEINEVVKRPLESEAYSACIDSVGGAMAARILGQLKYGGSLAAVGLAGGSNLPASIIPFLLRGVNILGIDSVLQPYDMRVKVWDYIAAKFPLAQLEEVVQTVGLSELPSLGSLILKGKVKGRTLVDLQA